MNVLPAAALSVRVTAVLSVLQLSWSTRSDCFTKASAPRDPLEIDHEHFAGFDSPDM